MMLQRVNRIFFRFVGEQHIFNYCDMPCKFSTNCHKTLVPKNVWHYNWAMFVTQSLRVRVVCFADFVTVNLFAELLPLPLPNCILRDGLLTLNAADLKFFPMLTTSVISNAAMSYKTPPQRFGVGTTYWSKNSIVVVLISSASARTPLPSCWPIPLLNGISICLETRASQVNVITMKRTKEQLSEL